jgi:rhodanese-related sulfurtransferase
MNSGIPLPQPSESLEITAAEVATWHLLPRAERPRLIDCRESEELALCQIEGAEWIPLDSFPASIASFSADRDRGVVIFCHHGMRSLRAAMFLRSHGIENAYSMTGGIDRWSREIDPAVPRY